MEIKGKLTLILPAQTGTGKNGPWKKCDFVIETQDKFPKSICVTAWKEQADQIQQIAVGSQLAVSFDLSSREYNGKWYTDVKAWKIVKEGSGASSSNEEMDREENYNQDTNYSNQSQANDDLPF